MASGSGCIIVSNAKIGSRALLGLKSIRVPSNRGGGGGGTLPIGLYCRSSKIQNRCPLVLAQSRHHSQPLQFESNFCTLPSSSQMIGHLEASGLPSEQAETIVKVMIAFSSCLSEFHNVVKMRRQLEASGLQSKHVGAIIGVIVNVSNSTSLKEFKKASEMDGRDVRKIIGDFKRNDNQKSSSEPCRLYQIYCEIVDGIMMWKHDLVYVLDRSSKVQLTIAALVVFLSIINKL